MAENSGLKAKKEFLIIGAQDQTLQTRNSQRNILKT